MNLAVVSGLEAHFGPSVPVSDDAAVELKAVWTVGHVEVALSEVTNERRMRALWKRRQGKRATPLLLLQPSREASARVLGPQNAEDPVRDVSVETLVGALRESEGKPRTDAVRALTSALERLDRSGVPGLVIRGLLTKHVLTKRLRRRPEWADLEGAAANVLLGRSWRENLAALGYDIEERPTRGHLLRCRGERIAVIHPLPTSAAFSRMTDEGSPPEGLLVRDCKDEGVRWGLLATDNRFRLFPSETTVGAATARYLEMDIGTTQPDDWAYLGLLAPDSLRPGGLLEQLVEEAARLGNELRQTVEQRIRDDVIPALSRGLGEHSKSGGHEMSSPETRQLIEDATMLLLFRLLFFLYLEGRDYLPISVPAYEPHSATALLRDARGQAPEFDERATTLWDRFRTLVNTMGTGNTAWGVPAYNGDLFAADVLDGAELLEEAHVTDAFFGPALAALGTDPEAEDTIAGVDFGDLEITHLGRIYESLLSLRLSVATEPLVYDPNVERWIPAGKDDAEIPKGELFFQSESGGRKAAGVYYTPQVLVRHLVDRSLLPALDEHLVQVAETAEHDPGEAANKLFDFRVLDPAMGSAHFLSDALDRIAERIAVFLADHPLKPVTAALDELRAEARSKGQIDDAELLRRLVVKRCIYGVDLSQMAVEVARVTMWLASFVPGLSLAYLGHNLRKGDSLVGVAHPSVTGDLDSRVGGLLGYRPITTALARAQELAQRIAETPDRTPDEVEASRAAQQALDETLRGLEHVFDAWTAEPFGVKSIRDWLTIGAAEQLLTGKKAMREEEFLEPAVNLAEERDFFHWPVVFPEVFARERPGFDVVIGNPPWEELTVEELAFYALHDPGIRGLRAEADRRKRIDALQKRYPSLAEELDRRKHDLEDKRRFFGPEGGYVAQGTGDTDTYKLFCERYGLLARQGGWLGVVLPRSAFLVDGARRFRRWLFGEAAVRRIDFILNAGRWAFPMEPRYTIGLLSAQRSAASPTSEIRLTGPSASQAEFEARSTEQPGVAVPTERLAAWTAGEGGSGYEVPLLPTQEAVVVFDRMRSGPRFAEGYPGVWSAFPVAELHETADKKLFSLEKGIPVWKGRSFDQFDPHGRDPAGFANEKDTLERLQNKRVSSRGAFRGRFPAEVLADPKTHPYFSPRIAFRDVSRATDSRTVRACVVPPESFLTNSAPYLVFPEGGAREQAFVVGVMNSLAFDWQARRFVETHMNFFVLSLLCFPPPDTTDINAIGERAARLSCVDDRFGTFAKECGVESGSLDDDESSRLRAELDALVAFAYRLTTDDLEVMFSDFTESAVPIHIRKQFLDALDSL